MGRSGRVLTSVTSQKGNPGLDQLLEDDLARGLSSLGTFFRISSPATLSELPELSRLV